MTLQEFKELLKECKVETEIDFDENTQLNMLKLDSLDISLVKYEIESTLERDIDFVPNQTIGQLLESINL